MSLAILLHFLCSQHVSGINISIIRSLRLCCWITTLVVLFLVRCVLEIWCGWVWSGICVAGWTTVQPRSPSCILNIQNLTFVTLGISLPRSQQPASCSHTTRHTFCNAYFSIILQPRLYVPSNLAWFPHQNSVRISLLWNCHIPHSLILHDFMALK